MTQEKPDFSSVYEGLKDFQKRSADYIFDRFYKDPDKVNRFLLADEVGLGKTLVAKGVIAKSLDYLWDQVERLDVVYICSNADIARQNINRLILTDQSFPLASRITMLPAKLQDLNQNKSNFISFTPGTSFNLRSSTGIVMERALIYSVLKDAWGLGDDVGSINLMQCSAYRKNWREYLEFYLREKALVLDEELKQAYIKALNARPELKEEFLELSDCFRGESEENLPWRQRNRLIGELRFVLATSCIHAMKPEIIILDEFQRFKHLLDDQDPMSKLAQHLFTYSDATRPVDTKILLLSATPYKMYTMYHEAAEEEHYSDFIRTLRFLYDSDQKTEELKHLLYHYRRNLYNPVQQSENNFLQVKNEIEARLRKLMTRTERLAVSKDRNGMIKEHFYHCKVEAKDLLSFNKFDAISRLLGTGDHLEFWKSSPYLLNIMDDYAVKKKFKAYLDDPGHYENLAEHIKGGSGLLRWSQVRKYQNVDLENPRLRKIVENNVDKGWKLLWMPPSLPYYQPSGIFKEAKTQDFTKMLIFSSWKVVPKALATLCSYDAERRAISAFDKTVTYGESAKKIVPLLQFGLSQERYTGMPALALLYPCLTLANKIDPLQIACELGGQPTKLQMITEVKAKIETLLTEVFKDDEYPSSGPFDEKWYWAALALLDRQYYPGAMEAWLSSTNENSFSRMIEGKDDGEGRFDEHVREFTDYFDYKKELGRVPDDLFEVLAKYALASPAVSALRSLSRKVEQSGSVECLAAASKIAVGFRTTFNLPVSIAILRQGKERMPYWKRVLDYCVNGNLQAVLDEYVHVLYESLGLPGKSDPEVTTHLSNTIYDAVSLRTTRAEIDEFNLNSKKKRIIRKTRSFRCRYALRMQESRNEDGEVTREEQVRTAFNSPFRPFILATTSIGQEGLDFHQYCHAICHWNLPSNPVDLEQREGRIHRYKGHVIRKNIASHYGLSKLTGNTKDPWDNMFQLAVQERKPTENDLVPYWMFETDEGSKIERHLPMLPLSREITQLEALKRGLVLYRLVFGQPRQEDLINFLQENIEERVVDELLSFRIDLEPRSVND